MRSVARAMAFAPWRFASRRLVAAAGRPIRLQRFFAVHNVMLAIGLTKRARSIRGLSPRARGEAPAHAPGDLRGGGGDGRSAVHRDLALRLVDPDGNVVAERDSSRHRSGGARVCRSPRRNTLRCSRMARGAGEYLVSSWTGGDGVADGGAALASGGTCDAPDRARCPDTATPGRPRTLPTSRREPARPREGTNGSTVSMFRRDERVTIDVAADFDAALYLRKGDCDDDDAEVRCNDDASRARKSTRASTPCSIRGRTSFSSMATATRRGPIAFKRPRVTRRASPTSAGRAPSRRRRRARSATSPTLSTTSTRPAAATRKASTSRFASTCRRARGYGSSKSRRFSSRRSRSSRLRRRDDRGRVLGHRLRRRRGMRGRACSSRARIGCLPTAPTRRRRVRSRSRRRPRPKRGSASARAPRATAAATLCRSRARRARSRATPSPPRTTSPSPARANGGADVVYRARSGAPLARHGAARRRRVEPRAGARACVRRPIDRVVVRIIVDRWSSRAPTFWSSTARAPSRSAVSRSAYKIRDMVAGRGGVREAFPRSPAIAAEIRHHGGGGRQFSSRCGGRVAAQGSAGSRLPLPVAPERANVRVTLETARLSRGPLASPACAATTQPRSSARKRATTSGRAQI